jgi:hypothetical protein
MAKMGADDFLQTAVTHVLSRFIPHIATQYRQRRYSATGPFSIEIVDTEVRAMIQGGQIDQARSSAAGSMSISTESGVH